MYVDDQETRTLSTFVMCMKHTLTFFEKRQKKDDERANLSGCSDRIKPSGRLPVEADFSAQPRVVIVR